MKLGDIVWFYDSHFASKSKAWGYITRIKNSLVHIKLFENNTTEVLFISTKGNFWDNA